MQNLRKFCEMMCAKRREKARNDDDIFASFHRAVRYEVGRYTRQISLTWKLH